MLRRVTLSLLLALSLVAGSVTVALASWPATQDPVCSWPYTYNTNLNVTWRYGMSMTDRYRTAWSNAAAAWQATATPLYMPYQSGSAMVDTYAYFDTDDGRMGYTWLNFGACIPYVTPLRDAWAYINTYYAATFTTTELQQLAGHELGHAVGLPHIQNSFTEYAIMRVSIIRGNEYWAPRSWDVKLVNCVYPNWRGC